MTSRCWLLILVVLALPAPADACTIPVFRYALERWKPSSYEYLVFHKGKLPQDHLLIVQQSGELYSPTPNLTVTTVDLDATKNKDHLAVWARQPADVKLPWVVLRYPDPDDRTPDVWTGPLDRDLLAEGLYSHCRKKIIEEIGHGASTVFVLLESGNEKADADALDLLTKELARLEKVVELPKQDPTVSPLESELPLKVSFPIVRLSRQEKAEQMFVQMLLRSETGLADVKSPIVLPIFGRGRLLCALHDDDLTAKQLGDVARFLCAACSCRVKDLNPGVDLLFAADWEAMLKNPTSDDSLAPDWAQNETSPLVIPEPDIWAPPMKAEPQTMDANAEPNRWMWLAAGGAAMLVVVSGALALLTLARTSGPRS